MKKPINETKTFWLEFNSLWRSNWYDGLSTFNKKELQKLLDKYNLHQNVDEFGIHIRK